MKHCGRLIGKFIFPLVIIKQCILFAWNFCVLIHTSTYCFQEKCLSWVLYRARHSDKIGNACLSISSPNIQMFAFVQTKCPGGPVTTHVWLAGIGQAAVVPELSSSNSVDTLSHLFLMWNWERPNNVVAKSRVSDLGLDQHTDTAITSCVNRGRVYLVCLCSCPHV